MLSRIAESLFWIGRYVERADDTARILDVHTHHLVEVPAVSEAQICQSLIEIMGLAAASDPAVPLRGFNATTVTWMLAFDAANPSSIVSTLTAARANARGISEAISSEMWEALNATYNALPLQVELGKSAPYGFFRFVRERAAVLAGLTDSTMSRDDAWRFLVLGRSLERIDMLARLLSSAVSPVGLAVDWVVLLRSFSAHEAFLRTYRREPEPIAAAEFLLLDRLFPRSVFSAISSAEDRLAELDPRSDRAGMPDESRRLLGQIRANLEYRGIDDLLRDFRGLLDYVQKGCGEASASLAARYFRHANPISWTTERAGLLSELGAKDRRSTFRYHVEHESIYHYSDVVQSSYNEARITPITTPRQLVLDSRVEIRPAAATHRYVDYWGSIVHAFDLHQPHRELMITARSVVETTDQTIEPTDVAWGVLRTGKLQDEFAEFLAATEQVPTDPRLLEPARQISAAHAPREAVDVAIGWVRDQLTYTPGATEVHTSAITAWDGGKGVCQDFAHLALALTRAMSLPSRYCSGYLHPDPGAGIGDTRTGESHAWIEAWVGDWIALDPTAGRTVNNRYVLVARGRDYADVPPIKGIFHGGPTSHVEVAIRLTRLA